MIIDIIPTDKDSQRVRYPVNRFSAAFNGATGLYDFGANTANQNQLLMRLQSNSVYLIEKTGFFANTSEGSWLEGLGTVDTFPKFSLHFRSDLNTSIYPEPVRCANYRRDVDQLVYFKQTKEAEDLLIDFTGSMSQSFEMLLHGIDPLLAEVNFIIYQVINAEWVKNHIDPKRVLRL